MDFFLIQLGQQLTGFHFIAGLDKELLYDTAGLGLYLDLGDGLDLAGGDHTLGQVALLHLRQLRGIDLCAAASGRNQSERDTQNHHNNDDSINNPFATLLLTIAVTVHIRLLP